MGDDTRDELYDDAVGFARNEGYVTPSLLQRNLRIGYGRAVLLIEKMERDGLVFPEEGNPFRKVWVY